MEVKARLGTIRIAPRKVRLVSGAIKGMNTASARHQLVHLPKRSSTPMVKLLDSAVANAYNNYGLSRDNLFIKAVIVDQGPTLKRYRPKGFGGVSPIAKRTSRVTIVLDERVPGQGRVSRNLKTSPSKAGSAQQAKVTATDTKAADADSTDTKQAEHKPNKELGPKKGISSPVKRLFRRKSI